MPSRPTPLADFVRDALIHRQHGAGESCFDFTADKPQPAFGGDMINFQSR